MKKAILLLVMGVLLAGCNDTAQIASKNLSKAADNFEITRRIVFYNGITADYMLVIEGRCSITADTVGRKLDVTCKVGQNSVKKHFLGLSDNVTYFVEQLDGVAVNMYHHRVTFKPQSILPDIDYQGDVQSLKDAVTPDIIR